MNDYKKQIKELLEEANEDKYKEYGRDWQERAMQTLNEINSERGYYDDYIYDLASDEWDEICKHELETRGWTGMKFFLEGVETTSDYAYLNGYGNAQACDYDFKGLLEDLLEDIKEL